MNSAHVLFLCVPDVQMNRYPPPTSNSGKEAGDATEDDDARGAQAAGQSCRITVTTTPRTSTVSAKIGFNREFAGCNR